MRKFRSPAIAVVALALLLAIPSLAFAIDSRAEKVVFTDLNHGYIAGGYAVGPWNNTEFGFISKTTDGGAHWNAYRFGSWINGIDMLRPANFWAVGAFSNFAFTSADTASTWTRTNSIGSYEQDASPQDVVSLPSGVAVAAGTQPGLEDGDLGTIWRTADNGVSWSEVYSGPAPVNPTDPSAYPAPVYANFSAVDVAPDNLTLFAVGTQNRDANGTPKAALVVKSTNGGLSWSQLTTATTALSLNSVDVVDSNVAWIAGGNRVAKTTNGRDFTFTATPPLSVNSIAALSPSVAVVAGDAGRVAFTKDGGATWKYYTTTSRLALQSVAFRDATHIVAVGDNSNIIRLTVASDGSLTSPSLVSAVNGFYPAPYTLSMSVPSVSSYASAKITGRLKNGSSTVYNKGVKIEYSSDNITWRTLATTYTNHKDAGGYYYTYTAKPTSVTYYRASYSSRSYGPMLKVLPKVYLTTPSVSTTTMRYGSTYTVSGSLKPKHLAGSYPVKIQAYRYESGRWVLKKTYSAKASDYSTYTKYSYSMKLPYKGSWRIRAYHAADSTNASTYTGYRSITVK